MSSFKKIHVKGSIHLGHQRELIQAPVEREAPVMVMDAAGPRHEFDATTPFDDTGLGQALAFRLGTETLDELAIVDDGLVTSFGIFGAPGSGKTVLLLYLLEQLMRHQAADPAKRYGALILDPKAALVDDVTAMAERAGRRDDLRIIGDGSELNVIDCGLDPYELGSILVLAGRSAGIDASDPFWFQEWSNLFACALSVLRAKAVIDPGISGPAPVTLAQLVDALFMESAGRREIQHVARELRARIGELSPAQQGDLLVDIRDLDRFYRSQYVATVEAFISKAFGMFRRSRLRHYSVNAGRARGSAPFYEDIIENGRIVLVSVPPSEPVLAKTLCTLVKCLFQRTVLARGDLLASGAITNDLRPLVIACDEYSEIASEVPGQSMGDGQFLALARQYGCMALFATQSVNVLEASSLKESWRSVFSNFAAKIYMRLADNDTAEEATKLAGESDWRVLNQGSSVGGQGYGASKQRDLRERKNLPSTILTQVLKRSEAVVIGALDGGQTTPGTRFLKVPDREAARTPAARSSPALRRARA